MSDYSLAISLIGALAVAACQMEARAPDRLPSIPETAVWAGGVDGGAWLECLDVVEGTIDRGEVGEEKLSWQDSFQAEVLVGEMGKRERRKKGGR